MIAAFVAMCAASSQMSLATPPPGTWVATEHAADIGLAAAATTPARGAKRRAVSPPDGGAKAPNAAAPPSDAAKSEPTPAAPSADLQPAPSFGTAVQQNEGEMADEGDDNPAMARDTYFAGELGYNGLAGFGINTGHKVATHWVTEGGLGYSTNGWRLGARVRFNFLAKPLTPFVALGATYESGTSGFVRKDRVATAERVFGGVGLQGVGGVSYTAGGGFMLLASVGYLHRFISDERFANAYVSRVPELADMKRMFGSGPVISIALGYAF